MMFSPLYLALKKGVEKNPIFVRPMMRKMQMPMMMTYQGRRVKTDIIGFDSRDVYTKPFIVSSEFQ